MPETNDEPALLPGLEPAVNRIAIMQPYFLPYLGYFQLIKAVDVFVIYDNIKYTKKGWINRNRILLNGRDTLFTIPLAGSSDFLPINQKFIAADFESRRSHTLARIQEAYRKAPQFDNIYPVIERIFHDNSRNLFNFIYNSIREVLRVLGISTTLVVSSSLEVDHQSKGVHKVLAICNSLHAHTYINPIGGVELYTGKEFRDYGINLYFHNMNVVPYSQAADEFVSHLSIVDVLMYNSPEQVNALLDQYKLLEPADRIHTGNQPNDEL